MEDTITLPSIENDIETGPTLGVEALEYYYDRCREFVYDNIIYPARQYMWPNLDATKHQKDAMNAISKYNRVGLQSGHGTGKSSAFSWIGYWYLSTRQNSLGYSVKIPVIAPTFHQLYDIIWPEFKRWLPISRIKPLFTINQTEVYRNGLKDLVWARARSPKIPDHIQGNHAQHLLWIADEGFGITDDLVWETVEGSLTEDDNKIIFGGQHTVLHGFCHDAFTRDKEFWKLLTFNSEDSPIAKKEYSDRIARKYGKDSDIYRVRVKGIAPKGDPDAFISLERAEMARNRDVPITGNLDAGIDCARYGDDLTTVGLKRGNHVFPISFKALTDTDEICDLFIQKLRKYRKKYNDDQLCRVKVDTTGGYGAGVVDRLNKNITDNIEVIPVYFSGRVSKETSAEYYDGCSIMWGELRDQIDFLGLPDDDDLVEEVSTRTFKISDDNRVKIQPKSEYKKDYESSPDRADCLILMCTKRAGILRVFPYYRATDPKCRTSRRPNFEKAMPMNFIVYGSLWLDKRNSGLYGGCYFWGRKTKRLVIYNELIAPDPVSTMVSRELRKKFMIPVAGQSSKKVEKVIGNDEFFSGGTDFEYQLRKSHLRVKQMIRYDRAGSVMVANRMFRKGQIVIHEDLEATDYQVRMWRKENGKMIDGFPLCESLLQVVAELRDTGELVQMVEPDPYSKSKQKKLEELRKGYPEKSMRKVGDPRMDDYLLT